MNRVFKAFAIAFTVVIALVSCKKEDQEKEVALTGIELNVETQALQVGQDFQLKVTYKPENATTKPEPVWSSDAPAVATVDAGKVVAVAAGTAKITAKAGAFSATCTVTVTSAEEEIVPVEGNSAWSIIGSLLGKNWDTDFVCAEQDGAFVLKNVKLSKDDQIKFRKDKGWDENRGINEPDKAAELAAGTPVQAIPGGGNIIIPADGIYDLYYFAEKEAIVYVAKDAALPEIPDFTASGPEIEPNFPDWANIGELTSGNHTFKFAKDDNFAYFYSYRTSEGRFNDIWDGNGYIYFALDFDNDLSTGEELNGNGKYEYIGFIYCFGAKPTVGIVKAGDCRPSDYTVDNIIAQGSADDNGVTVEYCIPLEDLPELPEEFTIYTWGNKDMSKVIYKVPYEVPVFEKWSEVEAAGAVQFFQYIAPGWSPIEGYNEVEADSFDNLTVADGVYTLTYPNATGERWQNQFYMRPNPKKGTLPLKSGKNYLVSITVEANQTFTAFAKFCQYGNAAPKHEGDKIVEWVDFVLSAGKEKTLAYVVEGVDCNNVNFTFDFGTNPANTTVKISKLTVEETDKPVGPIDGGSDPAAEWDYTPSERYLAASNLWKSKVDDAGVVGFFYHYPSAGEQYVATKANTYDLLSFNQSTYVLDCAAASTDGLWSNQLYLYAQDGHFLGLDPAKTYNFKVTLGASKDFAAFVKLAKYDPNASNKVEGATIYEFPTYPVSAVFEGGNPVELETKLTGVEVNNLVIICAFGGNPAECEVYIKDIILEEEVAETGSTVSEIIATADNTEVELKEALVVARCVRGIIVTDGTKYIYAYGQNPLADVKVGDTVTMKGTKKTYNGVPEIDSPTNVVVKSSGNTFTLPQDKDITATIETYSAAEAEMISFTGTLVKSGSYYNVNIAGTTAKVGSIQYPEASLNLDQYADKEIHVTGFFNGISSNKYVNVVAVSIDEVVEFTGITIDGDMSDWASVPGAEPASVYKAFKVWNDADNFYFYVATDPGSRLWEGGAYLYLYFDWDNDLTTGEYSGTTGMGSNKYEAYTYMFIFENNQISAPTKDSVAKGLSLDNIQIAGSTSAAEVCEIEIAIPRANFAQQVTAGTVIGVNSYRSKDGGNVNFPGYVVK